jgi:hypothetical protein
MVTGLSMRPRRHAASQGTPQTLPQTPCTLSVPTKRTLARIDCPAVSYSAFTPQWHYRGHGFDSRWLHGESHEDLRMRCVWSDFFGCSASSKDTRRLHPSVSRTVSVPSRSTVYRAPGRTASEHHFTTTLRLVSTIVPGPAATHRHARVLEPATRRPGRPRAGTPARSPLISTISDRVGTFSGFLKTHFLARRRTC